jgi:cell division protein FtsW
MIFIWFILSLGLILTSLVKKADVEPPVWQLIVIFIAASFFLHLAVRFSLPQADPLILPLSTFLIGIGLTFIFRINPELALRQSLWTILSTVAAIFFVFSAKKISLLKNYKYTLAFLGLVLLLAPIIFGQERYGAKLWLGFGSLSFQPAEFAKILLVFYLAAYLAEKYELLTLSTRRYLFLPFPEPKYLGPILTMWLISLGILIFEKDLGTSLLFFGLFIAMFFIATGRFFYIIFGSLLFSAGATAAYHLFNHVKTRIEIWLNPWADASGKGYQLVQSLLAIASGSLTGVGIGQGYPNLIPAVHTDFIFSAIIEELGLLGGISLVVAFLLLLQRGLKVALKATDPFEKFLALGLTIVTSIQTFIILGGNSKLIPLTGITLPFISYGGSSLLSNFIIIALLLNISGSETHA